MVWPYSFRGLTWSGNMLKAPISLLLAGTEGKTKGFTYLIVSKAKPHEHRAPAIMGDFLVLEIC